MTRDRQPAILVVDDDAPGRKLLEGYLAGGGYRVLTASDGPSALRAAQEQVPDVVLLDVMMPGMTGLQVCQALKNHPRTRLAQIMIVTALDSTSDRVHGLDTGADDYLTKPVRREEFLAKVRALVRARALLEELERARAELDARNRELDLKKTLAQTLVHDLKNPLAAVMGNLDLVKLGSSDRTGYFVERCQVMARRMKGMILDLLDVDRLEQGRYEPEIEDVDLGDVASISVLEADANARRSEVTLVLDAPGDPCLAHVDPSLASRITDNLIANALSHSPKGSRVVVQVAPRREGIEISVADEGPGIPVEHRETVFEKYRRLTLREAGVNANRGLGLTFCRLAVEAHGGRLWIDDAPGGGALFRALLPGAGPAARRVSETLARGAEALPLIA